MVSWISESLLVSALLAAIVALVCRLFRPRAALCHALWVVVLFKLMTPPWVTSPWLPDGLPDIFLSRGIPETVAAAPYASTETRTDQRAAPMILRLIGNENPAADSAVSAEPRDLQWKELLVTALLALWAAGALAMAGTQLARLLRFRRIILGGRDAPEWLAREAQQLSGEFHLSLPRLTTVSGLGSALAWTIGHARILIPETLVDTIPANRWPTILAHELAHLKRRDHWIGWLQLFVGCVWWWNPVFWYARRQLQEYAEMACDAWVTSVLPERRHDYAEALIRVVELASECPSPAPALGMANRPAAAFERRLTMILRGRMANRLSFAGAGLVALFALLVVPNLSYAIFQMESNPTSAEVQQTTGSPPETANAPAPVGPTTPEPKASPKSEKMPDRPVHLTEANPTPAEVQQATGNQPETAPVPAPVAPTTPEPKASPESEKMPDRPVHLTEANPTPAEVQQTTGSQPETANAPPPVAPTAPEPNGSAELESKLNSPIGVEFEDIHLQEITTFISDSWAVNIAIDWRVVSPPPKPIPMKRETEEPSSKHTPGKKVTEAPPVPISEPKSPDYVTDGMVPFVKLQDVRMRDALTALLRPLNLTFVADRNVIWISSPEKMKEDATHPRPAPRFNDEQITKILAAPVGIQFESVHISEVLDFISNSWEVNVVLDSRVVEPPRKPGGEVKMGSTGYVTDGIVPRIDLKDVSLGEALEVLLRPLNLTFTVDRGFMWISSYDLINAPPLSAQQVQGAYGSRGKPDAHLAEARRQEPLQPDSVEVMRTFESRDGICLAQLSMSFPGSRDVRWIGQGDVCDGYALETIDPKEATVTLRRTQGNESAGTAFTIVSVKKAAKGNVVEPDPQGPVARDWNPPVSLLRIVSVQSGSRAQIQTAAAARWYREGESFEQYTLLKISLERRSVTLYDEKSDLFATLSLPPSGGEAPKTP